ncbi:MAG: OmpA family protein, partial [Pseudomonadota bacterium]
DDVIDARIGPTNAQGVATGLVRSTVSGVATVRATEVSQGVLLPDQPQVTFTRGIVLNLTKFAAQPEAVVGDVVTYVVRIRNQDDRAVTDVQLVDTPPPGLRFLAGSARLDGVPLEDPPAGAVLRFAIGTVGALDDSNGNGLADEGESGYRELRYRAIVGSGATPGTHVNRVTAVDVCDTCVIANLAEAPLEVMLDPVFDLGTIVGKVFHDSNRDGWQQLDEAGIGEVMVALDDGTYALTDNHGRYHFPAVRPGQRLVKINRDTLPGVAQTTTTEAKVLMVTPGLMAKASFGVFYDSETASIGRRGVAGIVTSGDAQPAPVRVTGSVRMPFAVVNGQPVDLPRSEVRLSTTSIDNVIGLEDGVLTSPVRFRLRDAAASDAVAWQLSVYDVDGAVVHRLGAESPVPESVSWDGTDDDGTLTLSGGIYYYQLAVEYANGDVATSTRELFGVNRRSSIAVDLRGGAFVTGSATLTPQAVELLRETATAIRAVPGDKIAIEGHTDWVGEVDSNRELSLRRAKAALDYLVDVEGLNRDRFVVFGYGESRPVASNATAAGRAHNRRVEIKGDLTTTDRAVVRERVRVAPTVRINGQAVELKDDGRFDSVLEAAEASRVAVDITTAGARRATASVRLPTLEVLQPSGEARLPFGARTDQYTVFDADEALGNGPLARYVLAGRTDAGNAVEVDGVPIVVAEDGAFSTTIDLVAGSNVVGLVARNNSGFSRIVNLTVQVTASNDGGPLLVVEPVPVLSLRLPPRGAPLVNERLVVPGFTEPGNTVEINGQPVAVDANGQFFAQLALPGGESLMRAEVRDPQGYTGVVERRFTRKTNRVFFMALADGKFGQLKNSGSLVDTAGESESYSEGRIAYYFKGRVAGKYLITSAFDTGLYEYGQVFGDFDETDNQRLIANLDPDQMYPVYGDDSTVVFDAQSRGRFYLAVESDQLDALVGNFPINLSDTELAAYQRTLYGAQLRYRSAARTENGRARTEVQAFAAEVPQAPVQDELRATGGSLYYLSQQNVIEGSEQINLVIRDVDTGLVLARTLQERNVDYTIRYTDGRVLFNRPISSMSGDTELISRNLMSGNPTWIEVSYETRLDGFDQTSAGVRARQAIGERLTVGATQIDDAMLDGDYALSAADAELRFGRNSRVVAEYARSSGQRGAAFVSSDGGFTYSTRQVEPETEGTAFKLAVELDAGEFIGKPDKLTLNAYFKELGEGFSSAGNRSEVATRKTGLALTYRVSDNQSLRVRRDVLDNLENGIQVEQSTVHWSLTRERWKLSTELQDRRESGGQQGMRNTMAAARIEVDWTDSLNTQLEHQHTLTGPANDQTTLGMAFAAGRALTLNASATSGSRGTAAQAGLTLDVAGRSFYLSQRVAGSLAGSDELATILGAESPMGENGQMYTEYQWGGSADRVDVRSLMGLRRRWNVSDGLSLSFSAEQSTIDSGPTGTDRYAVVAGMGYDSGRGLTFSGRTEWRNERGAQNLDQLLTVADLEYTLGAGFTLLGKARYGYTRNPEQPATDLDFSEASVGLAWRPVNSDRFNALARYTRLTNAPTAFQRIDEVSEYTSDVFVADWSLQLNRRVEWVGKAAFKLREELGDPALAARTSTFLSIQRLNLGLPLKLELGTEYRVLAQREADDQRAGWVTELMWGGIEHVRIGGGFNFTDFSDNIYSENDFSSYGWYFRLQGKY